MPPGTVVLVPTGGWESELCSRISLLFYMSPAKIFTFRANFVTISKDLYKRGKPVISYDFLKKTLKDKGIGKTELSTQMQPIVT